MASDDTRTRILNAAGPIFAEKGYEAATVREICHEAGVNLASVNYYFGGKQRLYLEAVARAHPVKLGPKSGFAWPQGTPAATKLRDFIRGILGRLLEEKSGTWQEQLLVREIMNPTPACRELLRERFQSAFAQLLEILDEVLPAEMPPHKRHQVGLSVVGQCVYYRSARRILPLILGEDELQAYYGVEQLAEHISQIILAALGLEPPIACRDQRKPAGCGSTPAVAGDPVRSQQRPD